MPTLLSTSDVCSAEGQMRTNPWARIGLNAWSLGVEASSVIALRLLKIGSGGAAGHAEVHRMVDEKIEAGLDIQRLALSGALGLTPQGAAAKTLSHYRRKVRANRRRLSKI
jgi:hypothetical protein